MSALDLLRRLCRDSTLQGQPLVEVYELMVCESVRARRERARARDPSGGKPVLQEGRSFDTDELGGGGARMPGCRVCRAPRSASQKGNPLAAFGLAALSKILSFRPDVRCCHCSILAPGISPRSIISREAVLAMIFMPYVARDDFILAGH